MGVARLHVRSKSGDRVVPIEKTPFGIGRGQDNDLAFDQATTEVSRHHAEILIEDGRFVLHDHPSKLGTFVNGERIVARPLVHGDHIHLGGRSGVDLEFDEGLGPPRTRTKWATASAIVDVGHVAALLEGLRGLGGRRVLDDVLALVLDAALVLGDADRAFIMLAGERGLEFRLARGRGGQTLPNSDFRSQRVPEEVFTTGIGQYFSDYPEEVWDRDQRKSLVFSLRTVVCLPLIACDLADQSPDVGQERRIGVLYLDSPRKGRLLSSTTRSALEALAANAASAIENARLYREAIEKDRLQHEMLVAADIQRLLLPRDPHVSSHCEAVGLTIPCRSIGGDFFDYYDGGGRFVFALGDVAGKGPPAALLSTLVLGILADQRAEVRSAAETVARVNDALTRRAIESRYVTLVCGQLTPDGRLTYCNAGHNPPLLFGQDGVQRLSVGGPPVGMFATARFEEATVRLAAGDRLVVYTDGVTEASNVAEEEFGEGRIIDLFESMRTGNAAKLVSELSAGVQAFATGVAQADDITALVISYGR